MPLHKLKKSHCSEGSNHLLLSLVLRASLISFFFFLSRHFVSKMSVIIKPTNDSHNPAPLRLQFPLSSWGQDVTSRKKHLFKQMGVGVFFFFLRLYFFNITPSYHSKCFWLQALIGECLSEGWRPCSRPGPEPPWKKQTRQLAGSLRIRKILKVKLSAMINAGFGFTVSNPRRRKEVCVYTVL